MVPGRWHGRYHTNIMIRNEMRVWKRTERTRTHLQFVTALLFNCPPKYSLIQIK